MHRIATGNGGDFVLTAYNTAGQVSGYTCTDGEVVGRTYSDRSQLATLVYDSTTIDTRAYDHGGYMTSSSFRADLIHDKDLCGTKHLEKNLARICTAAASDCLACE